MAWQEGDPIAAKYAGESHPDHPWPLVVIAESETCEPIFRVRSAYTSQIFWSGEWLSNSEGLVIGIYGGYVLVSMKPRPELIQLPNPSWYAEAPVPAPMGDGRYFGYGFDGVYDAWEKRWIPGGFGDEHWGPFAWSGTRLEMQYELGYWGEGWYTWLLLPPRIEFPPFDDAITFRVARTGSCLYFRTDPDPDAVALDCLPDGARLTFAEQSDLPHEADGTAVSLGHPSIKAMSIADYSRSTWWISVRTASGAEGWVSHEYLEWD